MSDSTPPPERSEALLHLLLERGETGEAERTAELLRARNDVERAVELDDLHNLLERSRALFSRRDEWNDRREKALVKRVLTSTTRQDLRWRRDLALVRDFLRYRLGSSPALRVVAAMLLLGFFTTSIFAWLASREPDEKGFNIIVEPPSNWPEPVAAGTGEPTPEAEAPAESVKLDDAARRALRIENVQRRDRYLAHRWRQGADASVDLVDDAAAGWGERLLRARALGLRDGIWPEWLDDPDTLAATSPWERTLLAEVLLDRTALTGTPAPNLARALARIGRESAAAEAESPEALVRARASGYGFGDGEIAEGGEEIAEVDEEIAEVDEVPELAGAAWARSLAEHAPTELAESPLLGIWGR